MGSYTYKGVTSLKLYSWMTQTIPAELLSPFGQPVQTGTYNNEELVIANRDGSVMMPQATGPPLGAVTYQPASPSELNSVYDAYVQASPWTMAIPTLTTPLRVQAFSKATTGSQVHATGNVTVGNLLFAFSVAASGFPAITDTIGLTWLPVPGTASTVRYAVVAESDEITVTGTDTLNTQGITLTVVEVTQANIVTPIDVAAHQGGFGTLATITTGTPTQNNDLAIGWVYTTAGTLSARAFSPALLAQTDEAIQTDGVTLWSAVSDGSAGNAAAQTFSATLPSSTWTAECLLIQGETI